MKSYSRRILLVSPLRNYSVRNGMYPSGALLLLGSVLEEEGHIVKVVHMVADRVNVNGFCNTLKEFNPDIVGFTMSTYQTKAMRVLVKEVKLFNENVLIIAGGCHPSALKAQLLEEYPSVDIVVYGEGEDAIKDIAKGILLADIEGICYRSEGKIVTNKPSSLLQNLDGLPLPNKSLVNFKRYSGLFPAGRRPCMFIMSSRGCPWQCTFCSKSVYGNTLRLRSPENIMAEVDLLYKDWGVKEIHFGDDTFNANRRWADELLSLIIKGGYNKKLVFRVALRVDEKIIDLDLLKHLKTAGVWFAYIGVESGNQAMLDRMRKGITIEEIKRAFALAHQVDIKTEAFFIVGMPGETPQTIQDSYNLYKSIKPFWGGFSKAMPFPGTAFTKEVKATGHLLCEDYDNFEPSNMVVRTEAMTSDELNRRANIMNRLTRRDKVKHLKQVMYVVKDRLL